MPLKLGMTEHTNESRNLAGYVAARSSMLVHSISISFLHGFALGFAPFLNMTSQVQIATVRS